MESLTFIALMIATAMGIGMIALVMRRYVLVGNVEVADAAFSVVGATLLLASTWQVVRFEVAGVKVEMQRVVTDKKQVEDEQQKAVVTVFDLRDKLDAAQSRISELEGSLKNAGSPIPAPEPPAPARPVTEPPIFEEARANIRWVIQLDAGARATYDRYRAQGQSPYQAVLAAEGHNQRAQASISAFGSEKTEAYIRALGGN